MKLQDVLQKSTYSIEPGRYCVAKVTDSFNCANCFMVSKDDFETTVICKEALIGGPGAGKSTLLLKMAVQLSEKNLDNYAAMIPIYVQCGLLSSYDRLEDEIHLSGYSEEEKKYLWENGKLCLLFDGINEAVNVEMGKLLRDVVNLSEEYPECRYVINCRAIEFPIWASSYFEPYSILPVKDEQIRTQFCKEFGDVTGEKYYTELINSLKKFYI